MTNLPKNDYVNVFKPERPPGRFVSAGVHAPSSLPGGYAPSNPLAWGPKGEWGPKKSAEALNFEAQYAATESYVLQDGASARGGEQRQRAPAGLFACADAPRRLVRARARTRRRQQAR